MITIKLNPYERKDIISYLEKAKEKVIDDDKKKREKFTTLNYDLARIDKLIDIMNGNWSEDYQNVSLKSIREKGIYDEEQN